METYSLLVEALDQFIDRETLEEASLGVPSVARADCARLHRELFGILIEGLPHQDAVAFQLALRKHHFPTRIVADKDLPTLPMARTIQRVIYHGEVILFSDAMERQSIRRLDDLVFAAAGRVNVIDLHLRETIGMERDSMEEPGERLRFDWYFHGEEEPASFRLHLGPDMAAFFNDRPVRLKTGDPGMQHLMEATRGLLPAERLNSGLGHPALDLIYPSPRCYEKEIRWRFRELGA